MVEAARIEATK